MLLVFKDELIMQVDTHYIALDLLLCNTERRCNNDYRTWLVGLYGKSLVTHLIETTYCICLLYMKTKFGMSKSRCLIVENLRKPNLFRSSIRRTFLESRNSSFCHSKKRNVWVVALICDCVQKVVFISRMIIVCIK